MKRLALPLASIVTLLLAAQTAAATPVASPASG